MDQEATKEFIRENILLRTTNNTGKKSKKKKNNAFGTVCFKGFGQEASRNAPYVKVSNLEGLDEAEVVKEIENVWTLLMNYWQMRKPKLIISVTGGAKDFAFTNNRLVSCFKRGLIKAATSADAWITTGGTNTGIMEIVGEAVREHMLKNGAFEHNVVVLGIVTWGIILNKAVLRDNNNQGRFPCEYNFSSISEIPRGKPFALLDPNHTHFILVDSKKEEFGGEIDFRARLEEFRSKRKTEDEPSASVLPVPVVLLVVEGGLNTLRTASQAMEKNMPVVIIEGFGRAADLIAAASRLKDQEKRLTERDERDLKQMILKEFQSKNGKVKNDEIVKDAMNCIKILLDDKNKNLLTIFRHEDEESNHDIDEAIINAVLKANSSDIKIQLELTLAFNRCDIAKEKIFTYENNENWKKLDLNEALFKALVEDKDEFVKLFLDCGVDLKAFLTIQRLKKLYEALLFPTQGIISDMIKNTMRDLQQDWLSYFCCKKSSVVQLKGAKNLLEIASKVIHLLTDDQLQGLYEGPKFVVEGNGIGQIPTDTRTNHMLMATYLSDGIFRTTFNSGDDAKTVESTEQKPDFEYPERELFIWALLFNRKSIALTFWKCSRDHIGGVLIAGLMMKSLAKIADKEEELDLEQELISSAQEFELIATGVLNECHIKDKQMSHVLLVRDLDMWGGKSLLLLADNAEQMDFMGHTCCQSKLNKSWKGKMALTTPTYKILVCLVLPFLVHSLIKFSTEDVDDSTSSSSSANEVAPHSGSAWRNGGEGGGKGGSGADWDQKKQKRRRKLGRISFFKALYYFETAPVVKFFYHSLSYLVFLGLFSFFVLTDLRPHDPSAFEYLVWVWATTMFLDELRQILASETTSLKLMFLDYFTNVWNQFDLFVYTMLATSVILRYCFGEDLFVWARMFYVSTLALFYLRFLQTFYVSKNIGPKVIMIRRMLTDLLFFILLLVVFLVAYGIAAHALLYPNAALNWNIFRDVLYMPYFNIYGEFNLDEVRGDVPGCTNNQTVYDDPNSGIPRCPEQSWLVMIFFAVYLILTNILLINLLIAMFSYTFQSVQDNSEKVWRYYRYGLINEYNEKPALVPPLIIISHFWILAKYIYVRCCWKADNNKIESSTDLKKRLDDETNRRLTAFEHAGMENYFIRKRKEGQDLIDYKVATTSLRVEKVAQDVEYVKETVATANAESPTAAAGSTSASAITRTTSVLSFKTRSDQELQKFTDKLRKLENQMDKLVEVMNALAALSNRHDRKEAFQETIDRTTVTPQTIIIRDFEDTSSLS